jgi:predicted dehydrogenase
MRKIKLGMVGGGKDAFIGSVHRMAARLDDRYDLVAGALSSSPIKASESAAEIGIDKKRSYTSFQEMAKKRRKASRWDRRCCYRNSESFACRCC